jgi:addiction module HigA family antidote
MRPLGLSAGRIARACGVPRTRIERVATEQTAITADTALRLSRFFGNSPEFWLRLQECYDIETTRREIEPQLKQIRKNKARASAPKPSA